VPVASGDKEGGGEAQLPYEVPASYKKSPNIVRQFSLPPWANNESSEVVDILLPVTIYFNTSTTRDKVKNFWRFVIFPPWHPRRS